MLIIRDEQQRAMARAALPDWITKHLRQFFPRQCVALGEAALRERVHQGIARAIAYGFETETQISQYVDLMFVFGADFDTDPALSWPRPLLADPARPAALRMEQLLEAGRRHGEGT
jgi:hypothetical protein